MMKHYELQPIVWHESPLIFDWDEETGDVSGQSADYIKRFAIPGMATDCRGCWHTLSNEPLKSKEDMAAICSYWWELPDDLAPYYPSPEEFDQTGVDPEILALMTY